MRPRPFKLECLGSRDIVGIACGKSEGFAWSGSSAQMIARVHPFRANADSENSHALCGLLLRLRGTPETHTVLVGQLSVLGLLAIHFEALSASGCLDSLRVAFSAMFSSVKDLLLSWSGRLPKTLRQNETFLARVVAARGALFAGWFILQPTYQERQLVRLIYIYIYYIYKCSSPQIHSIPCF